MALWWIWNAVLLVVVIPAVIFLLRRVLVAAVQVRKDVDEIATVGAAMVSDLAAVEELPRTQTMVGMTKAGLEQYGTALDQIL